jgi:hypothetical protein
MVNKVCADAAALAGVIAVQAGIGARVLGRQSAEVEELPAAKDLHA